MGEKVANRHLELVVDVKMTCYVVKPYTFKNF